VGYAERLIGGVILPNHALCFAMLLAATSSTLACGSDSDSAGSAGTTGTGICTGRGWRDTCLWTMTCQKGRYELFCSPPSDPQLEQAAEDAGVLLDGTECACVVDETQVTAVPFDDSFCSSNFDSMDADRDDKALLLVNDICGWATP
jgi:hypothetical protein